MHLTSYPIRIQNSKGVLPLSGYMARAIAVLLLEPRLEGPMDDNLRTAALRLCRILKGQKLLRIDA